MSDNYKTEEKGGTNAVHALTCGSHAQKRTHHPRVCCPDPSRNRSSRHCRARFGEGIMCIQCYLYLPIGTPCPLFISARDSLSATCMSCHPPGPSSPASPGPQ